MLKRNNSSFVECFSGVQVGHVQLLDFKDDCAFVTAHLEIFHCTHHPVIPKSDLYFTFCSTLNALSKRTSK